MRSLMMIRIAASVLILALLAAGCEQSGGTPAQPLPSPGPDTPAVPAAGAVTQPAGSPFDAGGAAYSITPAEDMRLEGSVPSYREDAAFFAGGSAGWLIMETAPRKLVLSHTNDGGASWSAKALPGERGDAVHFADEANGFVLVSDQCATDGEERCGEERLLVTADGGDSWEDVWRGSAAKADMTGAELAFPGGASGYALTKDGTLLASQDQGSTWTPVAAGSESFRAAHMSFVSAKVGWVVGTDEKKAAGGKAATTLQVWKTEDAGAHWKRQFQESGAALGSSGIAFYDKNNGYFAIGDYDMMNGRLMRTTDGGAHWTEAMQLSPARPTPMGIRLLSADEGWIPLDIGAGPIDGGLLHFSNGGKKSEIGHNGLWSLRDAVPTGGGTGWAVADSMPGFRPTVLKTADGGQSWRQAWPAPHPVADVIYIDDRHGFGIGRESEPGAFMRTDDGGVTWQVVSELGVAGKRLYLADTKHGWVLGTSEDGTKPMLMETADGGVTWRIDTDSLPGWSTLPQTVEMKFFNDAEGMLAMLDGRELRVLRTGDGGRTWKAETPAADIGNLVTLAIVDKNELRITELVSKPDKTHWIQLSSLSLDGGSRKPLGKLEVDGSLLSAIYPSEHAGAVLTYRFDSARGPHLLVTTDGGRTWSDRGFPDAVSGGSDWSTPERFGSRSDSAWWLLIQGHLLLTEDAGGHWTTAY